MSKNKLDISEVSIVIPVFNGMEYIDQLIENITYYYQAGCELIIVEDGSKETVETKIAKAFPKAIYVWQENKGAAAARNHGVVLATGTYLQLMDVDDSISKDKISVQFSCAEKFNADVVYSDWRNLYIDSTTLKEDYQPWIIEKQHEDFIQRSLRGWWTPTPCPLIRKQAYIDIGGMNEKLKVGEDTYFFHELAMRGYNFHYCPGKFFTYHRHEDKMSLSKNEDSEKLYNSAIFDILKNDFQILSDLNKMTPEYHKIILVERFHVARDLVDCDWEESLRIEKNIREIDPKFDPSDQTRLYRIFYLLFGFQMTETLTLNTYRKFKQLFN